MKYILWGIVGSLTLTIAQAANNTELASPAKVFQSVLVQVKAKTEVPILLPSEFPPSIKTEDIHYVQGVGNPTKYEITLYYEQEGDAGFLGYFSGEVGRKPIGKGKKVILENSINGYFKGKSCGGSCSPSQIDWLQDNVLYTMQLKLPVGTKSEEERVMRFVANSAIHGGAR